MRVKVKVRRVKVKVRRVRARRSSRTAAVGHRPSRLVTAVVMVMVMVAAAAATVRARRSPLRRKPAATVARRANPKAHGRLALHCLAASRAAKAAAVQVDAIHRARDNAGVKWRDEGAGGMLACAFCV